MPLYVKAVVRTEILSEMYQTENEIVLWDFDCEAYDYKKFGTFKDALNNPKKKMGHAIVLAGLLEKMYGTELRF